MMASSLAIEQVDRRLAKINKAKKQIGLVSHSMGLEKQSVDKNNHKQFIIKYTKRILAENKLKQIWDVDED